MIRNKQKLVAACAALMLMAGLVFSMASAQTSLFPTSTAHPQQRSEAPSSSPQSSGDIIGPLSHIQAPPANYRYPDGTTYVYEAEWRLWKAGTATLRIDAAGKEQKVTAEANSSGVVALLYGVQDKFEAFFDTRTFCTQKIFKHAEEGFHKRETNIQFDYVRRKALLDERNLKSGQTKHTEEDIPACVTGVLPGIYYLASLPLQLGTTYTFPFNDGGKTVDVQAEIEAREQVKTDAGTFQTLRSRIEATSGLLKKRGNIWIWYSDDATHIPVQMRARAFWGTLTLRLVRVEKEKK